MPLFPKEPADRAEWTIPRRFALAIAISFLLAGLSAWALSRQKSPETPADEREAVGLMSTLPIYWGQATGMDDLIAGTAEPHWARGTLETAYDLVLLDTLVGVEGLSGELHPTGELEHLLLAQPRALSGAENVALDDWVRRGGQLLLFADPMMTGHSPFPIGDRRRPQDVILLSPILTHWGLSLQFDEAQDAGERVENVGGIAVPVNLAGRFQIAPPEADREADPEADPDAETAAGVGADCIVLGEGVAVDCTIGAGRALILADAAVLDHEDGGPLRDNALRNLANRAFSAR